MHRTMALGSLLLIGCAPPTMYKWSGYDVALYDHYKSPQERALFVTRLAAVITNAEGQGQRVPPGCYAEYGWALYEEGRGADAIVYFQKESQHWPESRVLMEKLIRNASGLRAPAGAKGDAGTVEEGRK